MENLYTPHCIRTFTGIYINVFEPTPDMIDINDIAHALARISRFGGHLPIDELYSVAQHSVYCSHLVSKERKLEALLHDGAEAYIGDLGSPIKKRLPDYKMLEDGLMKVIAKKFGFQYPISEEVNYHRLKSDGFLLQRQCLQTLRT
jgi:hypothetical protein